MVFDTSPPASSSSTGRVYPLDRMFNPSHSSAIELPLSDERDLSQIEAANKQSQPSKWKMMSKRRQSCTNDMYATASRYHRLKPPSTIHHLSSSDETLTSTSPFFTSCEKFSNKFAQDDMKYFPNQSALITARRSTTDCNDVSLFNRRPTEQTNQTLLTIVDEESRDSIWPPSGKINFFQEKILFISIVFLGDHHLLIPTSQSSRVSEPPLGMFYSDSSITPGSSISSFNSQSNSNDLHASSSSSSQYSSSASFFNDTPKTHSSSSGYESNVPTSDSSFNSIPDHLFLSSPDSLIMPPPPAPSPPKLMNSNSDRNLVEQFIDLHLQKQTSFDQDVAYSPPSSFSSSSSSFLSQAPISTITSPICCRKCVNDEESNQQSSDTEDDSQSTTISTNDLPSQQQQQQQHQQQQQQPNKRPRSLPIAIQQPKGVLIDHKHEDDDDDDELDNSLQNSLTCHCSMMTSSRKKRFRTGELNHQPTLNVATSANGLFSENTLISTTTDKLHIDLNDIDGPNTSEQSALKQSKNSLEHFIMSPTDKVRVQMKYPPLNNDKESDVKNVSTKRGMTRICCTIRNVSVCFFLKNELKISQPEDIDFKRSKQKAIRVLYQNRLNLNSIQSPVSSPVSVERNSIFSQLSLVRFLRRISINFHREQLQAIVILH